MKLDPDLPFSSMSVRDYIATHVLAAMISSTDEVHGGYSSQESVANMAVGYADALIEELQKDRRDNG